MDTSKAGYVYVLQMEGHPYYKIGRTVNLTRRVGQISPQMPGRLSIVFAHYVPDCHWTESLLHRDFVERRLNGEWFHLDSKCLDEIRTGLLLCQARATIVRVLAKLANDSDLPTYRIEKYGRILVAAAKREDRRLEKVLNLGWERKSSRAPEVIATVDTTLDAEIVI